jgi:hypothetical protein
MELAWTPRRQGDAGELSAINWLFSAGAEVSKPLFENSDYDLVADFGDRVTGCRSRRQPVGHRTGSSSPSARGAATRAGMVW